MNSVHDNRSRIKGVIARLTDRGFGFIAPESGGSAGKDYFFHANEVVSCAWDELECGQLVTCELLVGERGPNAVRVHRLGDAPLPGERHQLPPLPSVIVVKALQECTTELLKYLRKHPDVLRDLHPGTFENLMAEIFRQEGFETERISGWNEPDGGVDLIAVRHLGPGSDIRLAIQCKRSAQSRKVSAEPLRALAGVLDRFRAHSGVVATTGFFSEKAKEEKTRYLWRISLLDYSDILASLKRLRLTQ